jgi:hypothetical protein
MLPKGTEKKSHDVHRQLQLAVAIGLAFWGLAIYSAVHSAFPIVSSTHAAVIKIAERHR